MYFDSEMSYFAGLIEHSLLDQYLRTQRMPFLVPINNPPVFCVCGEFKGFGNSAWNSVSDIK